MKREIAALAMESPISESISGKTRSSKQLAVLDSPRVSGRLVYKRTRRSVRVPDDADVTIGAVEVSVQDLLDVAARGVGIEVSESRVSGRVGSGFEGALVNVGEPLPIKMLGKAVGKGQGENGNGALPVCSSKMVRKEMKNSSTERYPARFTRSALRSKVDDTGEKSVIVHNAEVGGDSDFKLKVEDTLIVANGSITLYKRNMKSVADDENREAIMEKDAEKRISVTPKRKLEIKMSKQIALANIPTTVKEILDTGLLEGCPVYYNGGKGRGLRGRIRGYGILCSCDLCQGCKVIPPSLFEIHACNTYKRAAEYICLENGRSFIKILKECKATPLSTLEDTIQNAIGPLPERKYVVCLNCKEPFSTMDGESTEAVCSSCVMSNLSPIGPVFSNRKTCRSVKSFCPSKPSQTASPCVLLPDRSDEKLIEKSSKASHVPKSRSSPRSPEGILIPKLRSSPRFRQTSEAKTANKITKKSSKARVTSKLQSSPRFGKTSEAKAIKEVGKTPQKVLISPEACYTPSMGKSSETRICEKPMNRLSSGALPSKLSGSTRIGKSSIANDHGKTKKRMRKDVMMPKHSKSPTIRSSSEKRPSGKITRKDIGQHRLVFEDDVLPDGTELGYYARGKKILDGYKKGSGIFCSCCDTVVSASLFEAHAGYASRRKPYCCIYTSNGVSLHELSVNLIKGRSQLAKSNDDLCCICADGGDLVLCDGCPRSFHMHCVFLPSVPRGKWYCKYCENMFQREKYVAYNANAVAAGRVSGVDSMEQISERSIRIVDGLASEVSSCILCRGYDFCKSGFGPRTIILCDQCEKEYHVGCLKDHKMADLTELPEGNWFCSTDCGRIDSALQNLIARGAEKLPDSLMNIIKKKHMQLDSECTTEFDVRWRLLSGKIASPETRSLLSQAVAIFHESFSPIIDIVSGRDLIPAMVYGRNLASQEYGGMYCAVLTINSVVVSAGIFRVFGSEVAELPLVATIAGNHGKGYFQALFACIESQLAFLKVESFVLPSAEEAESIWTNRFGFTKMTRDQLFEFKRNYWSMVRFQGTSMLHKFIPKDQLQIQT